ncbi:MAG TPA: hypothetical protein VID51_07115 [Solirubrobacterales bacterium]|jgi:hypothetical protein
MTLCALRYQASRKWMEEEILSGRPLEHRRHLLEIDPESLPMEDRERLQRIVDGTVYLEDPSRVFVLDSGIDPQVLFGPARQNLKPMDTPIVAQLGLLPELPEPTDKPTAVIAAWEDWIADYVKLSLGQFQWLIDTPPNHMRDAENRNVEWGSVLLNLSGFDFSISGVDGAIALQFIHSGIAWANRAKSLFAQESISAAKEATGPSRKEAESWHEKGDSEEFAKAYWQWAKRFYASAKAHDRALHSDVLDFDSEMSRWANEHGSERLSLGISDGYRMNAQYLTERLAAEAPGFFAMPVRSAPENWGKRANSPSEQALHLRRLVEAAIAKSAPENVDGAPAVEIYEVNDPPVEIYIANRGGSVEFDDLPDPRGWHWTIDDSGAVEGGGPEPFEAVVVHNWLGRFILVGAVADPDGQGPPWIWAVPEAARFQPDGTVIAEDPGEDRPLRAKRKPPSAEKGETDLDH